MCSNVCLHCGWLEWFYPLRRFNRWCFFKVSANCVAVTCCIFKSTPRTTKRPEDCFKFALMYICRVYIYLYIQWLILLIFSWDIILFHLVFLQRHSVWMITSKTFWKVTSSLKINKPVIPSDGGYIVENNRKSDFLYSSSEFVPTNNILCRRA